MLTLVLDGKKKNYYREGDVVVQLSSEEEFTIEKVLGKEGKILTTTGIFLDLTPDIKPTKATYDARKVVDKRSRNKFKKELDEIIFAKIRPDAIIPSKDDENGCYDIYANFEEDFMLIQPQDIVLIPTGIASAFSPKYRLSLRERGSSGSKGLAKRSGEVDSGYRGEIFFALNNTTDRDIIISKLINKVTVYDDRIEYPYSKAICQGALEIVPRVVVKEIPYEELKEIPSKRGVGALGSSGK